MGARSSGIIVHSRLAIDKSNTYFTFKKVEQKRIFKVFNINK